MKSSSACRSAWASADPGHDLALAGATVGTWLVVQHELNEAFDSALEETAQRILPLAVLEISNREEPRDAQHVATLKMHKEYLTYLVRDAQGQILMQSHDANPKIFSEHPAEGFRRRKIPFVRGQCVARDGVH
jgi:two-component system OmpR family sensor kinase